MFSLFSLRRLQASAGLTSLLCCGAASPALAHAHLTMEVPAANAVVTAAPHELRLKFSEGLELKFSTVKVLGPGKAPVAIGRPLLDPKDDTLLIVPLSGTLPTGIITVDWHAVSTDTHRTQGSYSFTVKP